MYHTTEQIPAVLRHTLQTDASEIFGLHGGDYEAF
jgi:hypothetical protein